MFFIVVLTQKCCENKDIKKDTRCAKDVEGHVYCLLF